MAGNKINNKKKEDKNKTIRVPNQVNEEPDDIDFSLLRKPVISSITGFSQARKIFDVATEELKGLISNECDLLYECKVCRNIFRSLVNFISHKRMYCRDTFNPSVHGHFIRPPPLVKEVSKIKHLEESYQEYLKEKNNTDLNESNESEDSNDRIPASRDLSEVIEGLQKKSKHGVRLEDHEMTFQKIPKSKVAVYQNVKFDGEKTDSLRAQVKELNKMSSMENAVLQSDGKFKIQSKISTDTENVIQISDDDDDDDEEEDSEDAKVHECKACDLQFTTLKTLKYHMKHKHLENRLVYPCPDCLVIFSTSWSVYRHLFKVHRKTAAQIRRLRESIQSKAFRMNNPPAFYEKRKTNLKNASSKENKTEEERLEQENQEWMDNMEGDGELPRCGGCGRTFARLAALAAHTNTCQPRSRALARRPQETKKIEIQIRKDYNKGPPTNTALTSKSEVNDKKYGNKDTSSRKSHLGKDIVVVPEENKLTEAVMTVVGENNVELNKEEIMEIDASTEDSDKSYENKFINRLPFAYQAEKSNLHALKQKMNSDVELEGLLCKKCDIKFNDIQNLVDHMATHYKWIRYGCKLCNFKHYEFEKLPEHIKIVHKLKGDTDFYFSTLKAIDGSEALEISESADDTVNDTNEASSNSRRPSRCSSDSSRLSDDSSTGSVRIEGSRKRKMNRCRTNTKRIKDSTIFDKSDDPKEEVTKINVVENDSSTNSKIFEENSSDIDDIEEKSTKYPIISRTSSTVSRRPIRNKTKPKNEDFEYDLSNLLKMEAQGYRDSQITSSSKTIITKKKTQESNYEIVNKEFPGALATLSRKSVENAKAAMKNASFMYSSNSKGTRIYNVFARPFAPKTSKTDKTSPKKDDHSPIKDEKKVVEIPLLAEDIVKNNNEVAPSKTIDTENEKSQPKPETTPTKSISEQNDTSEDNKNEMKNQMDVEKTPIAKDCSTIKEKEKSNTAGNVSMATVFPFKFGRGLDVMKNPIIKKNLTDFTKAGMKTKILVIKPINRNKDGIKSLNTPIKFQTIKLKDPNKDSKANEENKSEQGVVVAVPKVDCATRPTSSSNQDKNVQCPVPTTSKSCENNVEISKTDTTTNDSNTKDLTSNTESKKKNNDTVESGNEVVRTENLES